MTSIPYLFLVASGAVLLLGSFAVWSRRALSIKLAALALTCAAVASLMLGFIDLLSRPKPVSAEWFLNSESADILGWYPVEGEAIYLWLRVPESQEPRYYALPWNRETAEALQEAMEGLKEGETARMLMPFEHSWDDQTPRFYALPQPTMPGKDQMDERPQVYEEEA